MPLVFRVQDFSAQRISDGITVSASSSVTSTPQLPAHNADICGQSPAKTSKFQERDSHTQDHKDKHLTKENKTLWFQDNTRFCLGQPDSSQCLQSKTEMSHMVACKNVGHLMQRPTKKDPALTGHSIGKEP